MRRALLLLIALLFAVGVPGVASAHSDLESSSPFDGEVLSAPPTELTFTFNEALLPDFVNFVAQGADGAVTELTVTAVDGPTAVVAWPAGLAGGDWRVDYRVVSQDGHPVDGAIAFSYPAASPTPTTEAPSPTPTTAAPSPTTAPPSPEATSATASPTTAPVAEESPTSPGWIIAGIAVLALVAIAVIGVVARRRNP